MAELRYDRLKAKHREVRERPGFPNDLSLRVHRALSWVSRAEQAEDADARFIFYWIAFNSAYAAERGALPTAQERHNFGDFFTKLIAVDRDNQIYAAIWQRFSASIRVLLDNRYVFQPFWNAQNGLLAADVWQERFDKSKSVSRRALERRDTETILSILFDRLYVLRNQLIHGGATWDSRINRPQVTDGARVLAFLVPHFIDLMMDHPDVDWGQVHYPIVED